MKIPLSHLKNYIDHQLSHDKLAHLLTLAGLEVDGIHPRPHHFEGVIAVRIEACEPHPNAENLKVTQVSDGAQSIQVVCGASRCEVGMLVPLAQVGAQLFKNEAKPLKIKKAKLRGVESYGMLCAKEELGLEEKSEGLFELPSNTPLGCPLTELLAEDIMELSLTPNLGYCASMLGLARELSALLSIPYKKPKFSFRCQHLPIEDHITLKHQDKQACKRYALRLVKKVKVGPSPDWLKNFLSDCGMRPVNNVVDITNFVLMELGQPLHAFDYQLIAGKTIEVRQSQKGEKIQTIDHQTHTLDSPHLVIADKEKALALAGIMGGTDSEVNEKTQDVLLEAAYFSPEAIRQSSKALGLQSDSSWRFERGCDPQMIDLALDRASSLLIELAGGELVSKTLNSQSDPFTLPRIHCKLKRLNQVLGTQLSLGEVENIFKSLEFKFSSSKDSLEVTPPSYRYDIQQPIDLIEEVARIFGYNNLPRQSPHFSPSPLKDIPLHSFTQSLHRFCSGNGLREWITNDLINPELSQQLLGSAFPDELLVSLRNPNSQELSLLRPSLLPGMLLCLQQNLAHSNRHIQAYEIGKAHYKEEESFKEKMMLGLLLSGRRIPYWENKESVDFFDIKGLLESLCKDCRLSSYAFSSSSSPCLHPYRQASLSDGKQQLGLLGELHPSLLKVMDLQQKVYYAEINIEALLASSLPVSNLRFQALSLYPSMERDWTLLVDKSTPLQELQQAFEACRSPHMLSFDLIDLFCEAPIPQGKKSLTYHFIYQDAKKTLTTPQVEKEHEKFKEKVSEKLAHTLVL